ncbi:hypothetical protein BD410DRAFT_836477 [Rickenella mellea]|uniref:Uncharacterized protein n=1 Tax=Rickenella mellea TaxID=50990 RepID=A0A4Y7QGR9_9AGAM|nr:hypothetical protein BD410DRAFT_836477 [Rickenella mellea]
MSSNPSPPEPDTEQLLPTRAGSREGERRSRSERIDYKALHSGRVPPGLVIGNGPVASSSRRDSSATPLDPEASTPTTGTLPRMSASAVRSALREQKLRADPLVEVHGPVDVTCRRCGTHIKLSTKSTYDPFHWHRHIERCSKRPAKLVKAIKEGGRVKERIQPRSVRYSPMKRGASPSSNPDATANLSNSKSLRPRRKRASTAYTNGHIDGSTPPLSHDDASPAPSGINGAAKGRGVKRETPDDEGESETRSSTPSASSSTSNANLKRKRKHHAPTTPAQPPPPPPPIPLAQAPPEFEDYLIKSRRTSMKDVEPVLRSCEDGGREWSWERLREPVWVEVGGSGGSGGKGGGAEGGGVRGGVRIDGRKGEARDEAKAKANAAAAAAVMSGTAPAPATGLEPAPAPPKPKPETIDVDADMEVVPPQLPPIPTSLSAPSAVPPAAPPSFLPLPPSPGSSTLGSQSVHPALTGTHLPNPLAPILPLPSASASTSTSTPAPAPAQASTSSTAPSSPLTSTAPRKQSTKPTHLELMKVSRPLQRSTYGAGPLARAPSSSSLASASQSHKHNHHRSPSASSGGLPADTVGLSDAAYRSHPAPAPIPSPQSTSLLPKPFECACKKNTKCNCQPECAYTRCGEAFCGSGSASASGCVHGQKDGWPDGGEFTWRWRCGCKDAGGCALDNLASPSESSAAGNNANAAKTNAIANPNTTLASDANADARSDIPGN